MARWIEVEGNKIAVHEDERGDFDEVIAREVRYFYTYQDIFHWRNIRTVLDIGAHVGSFAAFVKQQSPESVVICVEPDVINYRLAQGTMTHFKKVAVYHAYCRYDDAPAVLLLDKKNTGHYVVQAAERPVPEYMNGVTPLNDVRRVTLEEMMDQHNIGVLDVLKLDCEGGEYDILCRAPYEVLSRIRYIVGEYHSGTDRFRSVCCPRLESVFYTVHIGVRDLGRFCFVNKGMT